MKRAAGGGRRSTAGPSPPVLVDGWAQGFALPAQGGRLVLRYDSGRRDGWLAVQLIVLMLVLVLAAPSVRAEDGLVPESVDEVEPEPVDLDGLVDRDTLPVEEDEPEAEVEQASSPSPSRRPSGRAEPEPEPVEPEPEAAVAEEPLPAQANSYRQEAGRGSARGREPEAAPRPERHGARSGRARA